MNTNAIINIAKSQLGLDEVTYRALLLRVTGTESLRAMSERQKLAVVDELKKKGFKVKPSAKSAPKKKQPVSDKRYIRLIHALWNSCHRLGVVSNGSRAALREFCRGILFPGNDKVAVDPDTLDYQSADKVIDVLKAMEKRGKEKAAL
ncbi:phage gp16-like protein [Agrobacterium vitis]|nr:phage gp16-like protein [Agrobacterium vitis]MBE1440368.1 phage gp16-like protein [Agrobacterium vitis]